MSSAFSPYRLMSWIAQVVGRLRVATYDALVSDRFTGKWYGVVLKHIARGSKVLDVGIGTAFALCMNASDVLAKDLAVVGIDIDEHYIKGAEENCRKHGIAQRVLLKHESFYDHMFDGGRAYDVIHFASSFMLMPDQRLALQHAKTIIKPGGVIIFAQTMEKKNFMGFMARYTKPLLTFFLRIDFGKVTYDSDFYDLLRTEGYEVQHVEPMARSVIKGGAQCILAKVAPSSAG